jgi:hypothetical protein
MNKLLSLLLLTPVLAFSQELPDEEWLCVSQNPYQVTSDVGTFELEETPNYIFNPSEGVREYDASEFDAASCRANTQEASFICSGTVFPDVELLFHMNTISNAFNYVRSVMSKRGGNTVVTVLGTCSKI